MAVCIGNPGPGGWACLRRCAGRERVLSGGEKATTNNGMELLAAIEGLRALNEPCEVEIVTDSQYVERGMSEHLQRWEANGWLTNVEGGTGRQPGTVAGTGIAGPRPQDAMAVGPGSWAP